MIRRDYIATDEKIKNMYLSIIKEEKRLPSQTEVADRCHLARQTVNEHLNKIDLTELTRPFKVFGSHVLMGLGKKAMGGDAQAAKLYFALIFEWSEKTEHKVEGGIKIIFEDANEDDKS